MGDPDLLLLDEPSEGLAPIIVKDLGVFIDRVKKEGMTVLLSEQNVKFSLKHADRAYIVDSGHIKYQGSIAELEKDEDVKKRYLAV
jgi:branched-chain amino acid transport system ATP-binding protein